MHTQAREAKPLAPTGREVTVRVSADVLESFVHTQAGESEQGVYGAALQPQLAPHRHGDHLSTLSKGVIGHGAYGSGSISAQVLGKVQGTHLCFGS